MKVDEIINQLIGQSFVEREEMETAVKEAFGAWDVVAERYEIEVYITKGEDPIMLGYYFEDKMFHIKEYA